MSRADLAVLDADAASVADVATMEDAPLAVVVAAEACFSASSLALLGVPALAHAGLTLRFLHRTFLSFFSLVSNSNS